MSAPQPQRAEPALIDPKDPLATAREIIKRHHVHSEGWRVLHHHQHEFFRWKGTHYEPVSDETLRSEVWKFLELAERWEKDERVRVKPNKDSVDQVMAALRAAAQISSGPPTWLLDWEPYGFSLPAAEMRACANGILHLPTRMLMPLSPTFFVRNSLPYAFDPAAGEPVEWLEFLHSLWPDDEETINALQEWFGLCLTPDTRYQKILLIVGPRRSGKGTIGRVITAMLGQDSVAAPSLASLGHQFGSATLIGKSLALISDARLSNRTDTAATCERLLSVSGQDPQSIERKHISDWEGYLHARFMLLSNELPEINDASAALASRFIILECTESFLGKEDHGLTDRLMSELPGILLWSLAGLDRLTARGRFLVPEAGREAMQELEDLASPVKTFVREICELGPDLSIKKGELYGEYMKWCVVAGITKPGNAATFGRNLRAASPRVRSSRPRNNLERKGHYSGISLKNRIS